MFIDATLNRLGSDTHGFPAWPNKLCSLKDKGLLILSEELWSLKQMTSWLSFGSSHCYAYGCRNCNTEPLMMITLNRRSCETYLPSGFKHFLQITLWRSSSRMKISSWFCDAFSRELADPGWGTSDRLARSTSVNNAQRFMFAQANEHLAQRPHCLTLRQLTAKRQVWGKAFKND